MSPAGNCSQGQYHEITGLQAITFGQFPHLKNEKLQRPVTLMSTGFCLICYTREDYTKIHEADFS